MIPSQVSRSMRVVQVDTCFSCTWRLLTINSTVNYIQTIKSLDILSFWDSQFFHREAQFLASKSFFVVFQIARNHANIIILSLLRLFLRINVKETLQINQFPKRPYHTLLYLFSSNCLGYSYNCFCGSMKFWNMLRNIWPNLVQWGII